MVIWDRAFRPRLEDTLHDYTFNGKGDLLVKSGRGWILTILDGSRGNGPVCMIVIPKLFDLLCLSPYPLGSRNDVYRMGTGSNGERSKIDLTGSLHSKRRFLLNI